MLVDTIAGEDNQPDIICLSQGKYLFLFKPIQQKPTLALGAASVTLGSKPTSDAAQHFVI